MRPAHLLLSIALLHASCLKDGVQPPPAEESGDVHLTIDMVTGTDPFRMDMPLLDGAGNPIRFTHLKFYMTRLHCYDDDGHLVADFPDEVVLMDGLEPVLRQFLGTMSNGHVHEIHFTTGLGGDAQMTGPASQQGPLADPDMQADGAVGRLHLLMRGYVDVDDDGEFDPQVDAPFDHRPSGAGAQRDRHLHVHADMVAGAAVILPLRIDVRLLLLGVDLLEHPTSSGDDPMAQMLMNNLAGALYSPF